MRIQLQAIFLLLYKKYASFARIIRSKPRNILRLAGRSAWFNVLGITSRAYRQQRAMSADF
jgi:hypothetical protein